MRESNQSTVRILALVALAVLLAAFVFYYVGARDSERGTSRDDSPAAEIGAGGGEGKGGGR